MRRTEYRHLGRRFGLAGQLLIRDLLQEGLAGRLLRKVVRQQLAEKANDFRWYLRLTHLGSDRHRILDLSVVAIQVAAYELLQCRLCT